MFFSLVSTIPYFIWFHLSLETLAFFAVAVLSCCDCSQGSLSGLASSLLARSFLNLAHFWMGSRKREMRMVLTKKRGSSFLLNFFWQNCNYSSAHLEESGAHLEFPISKSSPNQSVQVSKEFKSLILLREKTRFRLNSLRIELWNIVATTIWSHVVIIIIWSRTHSNPVIVLYETKSKL